MSNPRHTFRTSEPRFPGFWRRLFFLCVQGKWKKVHFSSYPSPRGREKANFFWQARLGIETVDSGFRGFVREQFAAWLFWKVVGDQQVAVGFDIFGLKRFLNKQLSAQAVFAGSGNFSRSNCFHCVKFQSLCLPNWVFGWKKNQRFSRQLIMLRLDNFSTNFPKWFPRRRLRVPTLIDFPLRHTHRPEGKPLRNLLKSPFMTVCEGRPGVQDLRGSNRFIDTGKTPAKTLGEPARGHVDRRIPHWIIDERRVVLGATKIPWPCPVLLGRDYFFIFLVPSLWWALPSSHSPRGFARNCDNLSKGLAGEVTNQKCLHTSKRERKSFYSSNINLSILSQIMAFTNYQSLTLWAGIKFHGRLPSAMRKGHKKAWAGRN